MASQHHQERSSSSCGYASYGDAGIICGTERLRAVLSPFVPVFGYEFSQPNPVHPSRVNIYGPPNVRLAGAHINRSRSAEPLT